MSVLRHDGLLGLLSSLTEQERETLDTVARFRLVRADHVERLSFPGEPGGAAGRRCRRHLARLTELGLVRRLERRIGGVRAGSAGHIYTLAPGGRRLQALLHGSATVSNRGVHEPGLAFVKHTLAITELYVRLREREREGALELLEFEPEPHCWRPYTLPSGRSGYVKPDALTRIGLGEWEELSFVEIDLGTEGRGALLRKFDAYLALYHSGREQEANGVFPRIAFLAPSQPRADQIGSLTSTRPRLRRLVATATFDNALTTLTGETRPESPR